MAFAHEPADAQAARELEARGIPTTLVPVRPKLLRHAFCALALLDDTPLTLVHYGSRALARKVAELASWADAAYAYSSSMGAFLLDQNLPRVMHMAELDSDKWSQYAARGRGLMARVYAREARTLLEFEARLARGSENNVFCTPLEERLFKERIPGARSTVLRNGVDLDHFRPRPELAEPAHLVFTGVMDYLPNTDGCIWFADEVFGKLRERHPHARFSIVGSSPTAAVKRLGQRPGIEVTGRVPDTADWLARASISVAPLRIARGIQNKVLEALAMGLAVVGTTSATQGVEGTPGTHFLVADDPQAQLEALDSLIRDPARAVQFGRAGREFVEAHYDWERVLDHLDRVVDGLRATRARA